MISMEHASENEVTLPAHLPDAPLGPYERQLEEQERKERKKKKHKSSRQPDDGRHHHHHRHSSDDGQAVKKKKKKTTGDGNVKKKKKKRRTPEEEYRRQQARRAKGNKTQPFDPDAPANVLRKSSRSVRQSGDKGIPEQSVRVPIRMEEGAHVDLQPTRHPSRELDLADEEAVFGVPFRDETDPSFQAHPAINWETGEGLNWPDNNDDSVMTPLNAFDHEPSLREDVEDPFVPVKTSFSGMSPGSHHLGREPWRPQAAEQGSESDAYTGRPGAHRVTPKYLAPGSSYSNSRTRRRSKPNARSSVGNLRSEKRRNTLPPGLYPIAETAEPPEKKKEDGALALFPVDENYDDSKNKSSHRLSYTITGESYSQFDTGDSTPGGTFVATRRMTSKRRRKKERGEGPSYFRSSESYNDQNLLGDPYGMLSYEMESQALGEDRLGAFAVRRSGTHVSEGELSEGDAMQLLRGERQQNILYADIESLEEAEKKNHWYRSRGFKLFLAFLLLAGVAVVIAVPLTLTNRDSSGEGSFTPEQIAARKEQLQIILEGVSDRNALIDESSPQYAACQWMASEDMLSPLGNGILSSGIAELIIQRYSLAVFYYSTAGPNWFSANGWLDGRLEECLWEFIECVNEDVVSIDTGLRNNLVGSLQPELKELNELRSLVLPTNLISGLPADMGMLLNLVELDLSRNSIGGTIPTMIFDVVSLRRLVLTDNRFTGTLPPLITKLSGLTELILDTNEMSGFITTEFQVFTDITYLDLSVNRFQGDFSSMFAGLNNLESLLLVNNEISGSIPPDIQRYSNLEFLDLGNTVMEGTIPSEIGTLTSLKSLLLEGIELTGTIPTELGNCISLETVYFDFNSLTGSVPTEMCSLPELTDLRVDCSIQCQCEACADACS